jgi:hypothetical protein
MKSVLLSAALAGMLFLTLPAGIHAQRGRGGPPPTGRAAAPIDLIGYWVSIVNEDWIWRMTTPQKGDFGFGADPEGNSDARAGRSSVPMNAEGRRVALAWDPAKDEAEGNQCKWYGAGNIMRVPGRLHITWENDNTLKMDIDAGMQTRLFHFGATKPAATEATWQGYSIAAWDGLSGFEQRNLYASQRSPKLFGQGAGSRNGNLKVVTTGLRPGYLRRNGVPYGANAVVTEHFRRFTEPNGDTYLVVTTVVEDPQYLSDSYIVSTNFKLEPNGSKWHPTPCTAR